MESIYTRMVLSHERCHLAVVDLRVIFQHCGDNRCSVIHLWVNQCWRWTKNKVFCLIFHHVFSWHLQRRMTDKTEREHKIRMRKSKEELKGREKDEKHYTKCKRSPTKGWSPPPLVRRCSYGEKQGSTMMSSHTRPCLRWGQARPTQVHNYVVEFPELRAP